MRLALVVTSDSVYRGEKEDRVTPLVEDYAARRGAVLAYRRVVPNDPQAIADAVAEAASRADIVIVTGGTGISPRDVTVDAVSRLSTREVPGFGEEHRRRSLQRVGPAALLSRATAYVVGGALVLLSPGSPDAVSVTLQILDEIAGHAVEQLRGGGHGRACKG